MDFFAQKQAWLNSLTDEERLRYLAHEAALARAERPAQADWLGLDQAPGALDTVRRGANQASAKILSTAGNVAEFFDPVSNLLKSVKGGLGGTELANTIDQYGSYASPARLYNKVAQPMAQAALAEPPTQFQQQNPNLGALAQGAGETLPELLLSIYGPATGVGAAVERRAAAYGPEVASNLRRAAQGSAGGFAGGMIKGEPKEAATNALAFPLAELGMGGLGYYAKQGKNAIQERLPAIREGFQNVLGGEAGAVKLGKASPPIPESPETLALQIQALTEGKSKAVLVTPGAEMPALPEGMRIMKSEVGNWIYDPKKLKPYQIRDGILRNRYGELLGYVEPKSSATTQAVAAVQDGVEAKTALASPENVAAQAEILQQQFPNAQVVAGGPELAGSMVHARMRGTAPGNVTPIRPSVFIGEPSAPGIPPGGPTPGKLERGFIQTVRESPVSPEPVAQGVTGRYDPLSNKLTMERAQQLVAEDPVAARDLVLSTREPTAESYSMAMELMRLNNAKGDFGESIRIAQHMAEQATRQGQSIQALSIYNRLGPDGILRLATKTVRDARAEAPKAKLTKLEDKTNKIIAFLQEQGEANINKELIREEVAKELKLPNISEEFARKITERASALQAMPEGREKALETAVLLRDIAEQIPSSLGRKIATFQTIAQLANPKTLIRNLVGNAAFTVGENVKDLVAAPLDMAVSLITGNRTKSLSSLNQLGAQARGFVTGLKEGAQEAWRGVDLSKVADKWEINGLKNGLPTGRTFRGKIMGNIERTLGVALRAPDRAFYKAAFEKSLAEQKSLARVAKPTEEMIARAHMEGLYKTFQDDSRIARMFSDGKKALNRIGTEDFGLGDILLKYPKTPGNLLDRSIEYSPAGTFKSLMELGKAATGKGFDQQAFVDKTARALIGTGGLTYLGYTLSQLGLLKNSAPQDPELRALESIEGIKQSQLNIDGLQRFIASGFDKDQAKIQPGDTLVSYDWAVPLSIPVSMGARAQEKGLVIDEAPNQLSLAAAGFEAGLDTLGEQPMIKTFTQLARGKSLAESLVEAGKGIPASFTPTILRQTNQLSDNTVRDPQDQDPAKMALNLVLNKTPFARTLPQRYDTLGNPMEAYQGGTNSVMNVLFNPAFMAKFQPTPETKFIKDLYNSTGENSVFPTLIKTKFKYRGMDFQANARQKNFMQRWVGERTRQYLSQLASNPNIDKLPDDEKIDLITDKYKQLKGMAQTGFFLNMLEEKRGDMPLNEYLKNFIREKKLSPRQIEGILEDIATFQATQGEGL